MHLVHYGLRPSALFGIYLTYKKKKKESETYLDSGKQILHAYRNLNWSLFPRV